MPTKKGVLKKRGGNTHTTIIKTAEPLVAVAVAMDNVSKVRPGLIKHIGGGGRKDLRIENKSGALKVVVRGDGAIQIVWVFTTDREMVRRRLFEVWNS